MSIDWPPRALSCLPANLSDRFPDGLVASAGAADMGRNRACAGYQASDFIH